MKYRDYYEVLGLPRTATQDEVRRAYRKLARKYHPDVTQQADGEARFKELGEAYQVLKDTEKRAAYDRLGRQWQNGQDFQPPPDWDEGFEFSGAGNEPSANADFSEFFEAMFGRTRAGGDSRQTKRHRAAPNRGAPTADDLEDAYRGTQRPIPGQDHHARVVIDLMDAYHGAQRSISLQTPVLDAHGHVTLQSRTLNVTIPKGVRAGQHLRLAGQGGPGASEEQLTLWIAEGVIEPQGTTQREWRFSGAALRRVRTARRLAQDLEINAPGIALALDLLDEINALRARSRRWSGR